MSEQQKDRQDPREASRERKALFPVSKIKAICKVDEDVKLIRADAVELVALATEMFIEILAEESLRGSSSKTRLTYLDVAETVRSIHAFDFLSDIVPPAEGTIDKAQFFRPREAVKPKSQSNAIENEGDMEIVPAVGNEPGGRVPSVRPRVRRKQILSDDSDSDSEERSTEPTTRQKDVSRGEALAIGEGSPETEEKVADSNYLRDGKLMEQPFDIEPDPNLTTQKQIKPSRLSALEEASSSDEDEESPTDNADSDEIEEFDAENQPPPTFA